MTKLVIALALITTIASILLGYWCCKLDVSRGCAPWYVQLTFVIMVICPITATICGIMSIWGFVR